MGHKGLHPICTSISYWAKPESRGLGHYLGHTRLVLCTYYEYLGNGYKYNRARAFRERESGRKGSKSLEKELECQLVPFRETGSCQVPFGEKEETPRGIWHLFGIVPELGLRPILMNGENENESEPMRSKACGLGFVDKRAPKLTLRIKST